MKAIARFAAGLGRDLRFGARQLRRQPGFTALAIVILALGLGAAIAMVSMVTSLAVRTLPFPHADRLVRVQRIFAGRTSQVPLPDYRVLRAEAQSFDAMTTFGWGGSTLAEPGKPPEVVWRIQAGPEFFALLGVRARLGRVFLPEEHQPGRAGVVLISSKLWQTRFHSDPGIIGRRLREEGETVTVVGVMAPEANDPLLFWSRVDVWRPHVLPAPGPADREWTVAVFARRKPGVELAAARAELDAIARRLEPRSGAGRGFEVQPLHKSTGLTEAATRVAFLTMGLALFVLLLACLNLAGVQLARHAARAHEQAVQLALGGGRGHLVRQALAESLILSFLGGGLGVLVAVWLTELVGPRMIVGIAHTTVGLTFAIDGRVLGAALGMVALTAVLVGILPAWLSAPSAVAEALKQGGRASTERARSRLRQGLLVGEMALALVLLAASGLFVRGLDRLVDQSPGWEVEGLLTGRISLPGKRYHDRDVRRDFVARLEQGLAALPGVRVAAVGSVLPVANFTTAVERGPFTVEGAPPLPAAAAPIAYQIAASPRYFDTLGVSLQAGRVFVPADRVGALPVAVINASLARHFWPGESAIGKRIGTGERVTFWRTVVGVVADVRFAGSLDTPLTPFQIYAPMAQWGPWSVALALRPEAGNRPEALAPAVRAVVAKLDPDLAVLEPTTARALMGRALANFTTSAWLLFGLALLGIVLAALGIYGFFAGFVVQHTREIGVRVALGARREQVIWLVLGRGVRLAIIGLALGVAGALAVARVLAALATELPPAEPLAFLLLAAGLALVVLLACWVPARRAAGLDPMVALRNE